jgi:hypothetical protein
MDEVNLGLRHVRKWARKSLILILILTRKTQPNKSARAFTCKPSALAAPSCRTTQRG